MTSPAVCAKCGAAGVVLDSRRCTGATRRRRRCTRCSHRWTTLEVTIPDVARGHAAVLPITAPARERLRAQLEKVVGEMEALRLMVI